MSEQTVKILIRLLLRSSLIRIFTVCHSFYIYWRHYFIVKLNCFILRTTTVAGLGVPIFRVFTVCYYLFGVLCDVYVIRTTWEEPRGKTVLCFFNTCCKFASLVAI